MLILKESEYTVMKYDDGILWGSYKEDVFIDLKVAKDVVELRKEATNNKCVPILIDARTVVKMDKAACDYFGSPAGFELISASAILTHSRVSTFLANFLIKVNLKKTPIPVKLFNNETEAVK
ncbi:MAG: hypothetical protein IT237_01075 [Bacteroidia bacterium]|nr:hypothetical protein [Bacteroidia bacterium]